MLDEEKEAIERLTKRYEFFKENPLATNVWLTLDIHSLGTVLNLIEKQSKEIEELKAISEYREKIIKGLGLKTLPKTITGFKELIENNDKKWEDKIKAMLENEIINISGFECVAKEDVQSLLEKE